MANASTISETRVVGVQLVLSLEQGGKLYAIMRRVNQGDAALMGIYEALANVDCELPEYRVAGKVFSINVHKED